VGHSAIVTSSNSSSSNNSIVGAAAEGVCMMFVEHSHYELEGVWLALAACRLVPQADLYC
jgi:hypothetical protein